MSAWVCSERHINLIASYAAAHQLVVTWRDETIACAVSQQRVVTVLMEENHRSVNHRYSEDDHEAITFEALVTSVTPVFMLKQLACYDYQACECDDYDATLAKAIVEACIAEVCRRAGRTVEQMRGARNCGNAEWQAAPWGI